MEWHYTQGPRWWPVIGDWHEDTEIIAFPYWHFHIDVRFIGQAYTGEFWKSENEKLFEYVRRPLTRKDSGDPYEDEADKETELPRPQIVMKLRKCRRSTFTLLDSPNPKHHKPVWLSPLETKYETSVLKTPVCPHRGATLNMKADAAGCVVCPLHGLKWDMTTGCMVRQTKPVKAAQ